MNNIILSPLFSTKHQNGSFFQGFTTPKGLTPKGFITPRAFFKGFLATPTNGIESSKGFRDEVLRPIPIQSEFDLNFNSRMDRMVDELKEGIQKSTDVASGVGHEQNGLNLDIDLINESCEPGSATKSPNILSQVNQSFSRKFFKRTGTLALSPNASSFQLRKKIDN